jgi:hypothetical protein
MKEIRSSIFSDFRGISMFSEGFVPHFKQKEIWN